MSLMGLSRAFKKHGALLGGLGAFLMLVVAISGLGGNLSHGGNAVGATSGGAAEQTVATVGDLHVTRGQLDSAIQSVLRQQMMGVNPSAAEMDRYRLILLSQYKEQAALGLAAKAAGVTISDEDVTRERDKIWNQQRVAIVGTLGLPAKATDSDIDKALAAQNTGATVALLKERVAPDDMVHAQLNHEGLVTQLKKQVKVTPDEVKQSYDEIQVRHILVKSGKDGLPDALAKEKAQKILTQVLADPSKMADLAKIDSDDPGSKMKGGFYDWAPAGQYVPEFSAGALAAGVGKVNPQPIKTSFGYHIIKLEGERPGKDFPKDWDKNKQKYIDAYIEKQAQSKVQEAINAQIPNVKQTILDPGMQAAQLEQDAESAADPNTRNAKLNEALAELNKIKTQDDPSGAAPLRRAEVLSQLKRPKDAIAAYEQALTFRNSIETRLSLATLYQGENDKVNALKQVQEAEKLAVPDVQTQFRIATMLDALGAKDESAKAKAKAADMAKRQADIEAADRAASAAAPTVTQMPPTAPAPTASGKPSPAASSPAAPATAPHAAGANPAAAPAGNPAPK